MTLAWQPHRWAETPLRGGSLGHARRYPSRVTTRAAARRAKEGSMVVPTLNDAGVAVWQNHGWQNYFWGQEHHDLR